MRNALRQARIEGAQQRRGASSAGHDFDERERRSAEMIIDHHRGYQWPERRASRLYRALVWKEISVVAAEAVAELVDHYRVEEGLLIDLDAETLRIDPDFDLAAHQHRPDSNREQQRLRASNAASALLLGTATPLPLAAVARVPVTRADRTALRARLRALGVGGTEATTAVFVLAYLSGNTADLDHLQEAPVLIDPGAEAKPVVAQMLAELHTDLPLLSFGLDAPDDAHWDRAVARLTPQDAAAAERARQALIDPDGQPQPPGWEHGADRAELAGLVSDYRDQLRLVTALGEQISDASTAEELDTIGDHLTGLGNQRAVLEDLVGDPSLLDLENTRLRDVLDNLDAGDLSTEPLFFVGESSLRESELSRLYGRGDRIAVYGAAAITAALRDVDTAAFEARFAHAGAGDRLDPLAEHSIRVLLADIADGQEPVGNTADLTREVADFLTRSPASDSAIVVATSEVQVWLDTATDNGRHVTELTRRWDERITEVCTARDAGTLRFAARELGSPPPQPDAAEVASLIAAALPALGREAHTPAGTAPALDPSTDTGAENSPQL